MKRQLFLFLLTVATLAHAQQLTIKVHNPSTFQRQEVIQVDARQVMHRLNLKPGQSLRVFNSRGLQTDWQVTHDSLLLVDAQVRPQGTTTFTVKPGKAERMKTWVWGDRYPRRKDDIAWENDRCAYRVYGPALQRTGEKAYGMDIWVKNTPDIVAPSRYFVDYEGNRIANRLRAEQRRHEGDSINTAMSFHLDHGNGYDPYQVGPTLGCGTPAIMQGDSLIMPYCYREGEILDNGPLRFSLQLTFNPTRINGNDVVEHRLIQLDKDRHLNRITVWYSGLKKAKNVAAGFVIHQDDTTTLRLEGPIAAYADPTDNVRGNNCQVYLGAIFPEGSAARYLPLGQPRAGAVGHAVGVKRVKDGEPFTYYCGAGWSAYDVNSLEVWQLMLRQRLEALQHPLEVTLE